MCLAPKRNCQYHFMYSGIKIKFAVVVLFARYSFLSFFYNPIYTTEKIGKARMKIGKGNFHFRQGKGKMCSLHTSVLPLLV